MEGLRNCEGMVVVERQALENLSCNYQENYSLLSL